MALIFEKIYIKITNHADWWKDYMTEMSILVISLAATFYSENLIQGYNDAQDDVHTMTVVVNELEGNIKEISEIMVYYHKHELFANALKQKLIKQETVAEETLQEYYLCKESTRSVCSIFSDNYIFAFGTTINCTSKYFTIFI